MNLARVQELDLDPTAAHERAGLAAIPERWLPQGSRHCNISDGLRGVTARLARTPHTLELLVEGSPMLHAYLTDLAVPGAVLIQMRPCVCLPASFGPHVWKVRRSGREVSFSRADDGATMLLTHLTPERLRLDVRTPAGELLSYVFTI